MARTNKRFPLIMLSHKLQSDHRFVDRFFINKVIRGLLGSSIALIFDITIMFGLIKLFSLHYLYAAPIGFSVGCLVNYIASKHFIYEDQSKLSQKSKLIWFYLVGVAGLVINQFILYIGVELLSFDTLLTKVVSVGIVFWFNFIIRGIFVFNDPSLCKVLVKNVK